MLTEHLIWNKRHKNARMERNYEPFCHDLDSVALLAGL